MLDGAREARRAEQEAAARILQAAVEWAALHEPTGGREASYWWEAGRAVPLAGEGAPEVSEWAVAEFAAAIGVSTDAGRALVGQALELAWRLPRLWAQVGAGRVPAWRARRVAEQTMALTPEAAAFVDAHVVAVAGKVGPVQLDRLVTEATRRFMPQTLPVDAYDCPDRRRVEIDTDQVSFDGTVTLRGEVDLLDALHLDQALTHTADQLALAGSPESLDARRARALGELARHQLALTLDPTEPDHATGQPPPAASRTVTLYLHLSEVALTAGGVGRCENTRTPVNADSIRAWCGRPDADVVVKPVIDLHDQVRVDAYEIPDRIRERVALRDVRRVLGVTQHLS
ncbi:MAG: HNH endonuclease [Nocardioides sp.]